MTASHNPAIILALVIWLNASLCTAVVKMGPIPCIRLFKRHNDKVISRYLDEKRGAPFNHDFAGCSKDDDTLSRVPKSFHRLLISLVVGRGMKDFVRASEAMYAFQMVNELPWAKIVSKDFDSLTEKKITKTKKPAAKMTLSTLIRCYGLAWSLNPCRVVYIEELHGVKALKLQAQNVNNDSGNDSNKARNNVKSIAQIAYSTVDGHLISGEERFRVCLHDGGDVVFEIFSFTKGSGLIGELSMPFIRPIQQRFFKDVSASMKRIIASEK
jgi:uncharacterized protein (UPF0548 family)